MRHRIDTAFCHMCIYFAVNFWTDVKLVVVHLNSIFLKEICEHFFYIELKWFHYKNKTIVRYVVFFKAKSTTFIES